MLDLLTDIGNATEDYQDIEAIPAPRSLTRSGRPLFILDPGHGSLQEGKRANGLLEWKYNRRILSFIKNGLSELGIDFHITIDEKRDNREYGSSLRERVDSANEAALYHKGPSYFISIHGNASSKKKVRGIETWFYPYGKNAQLASCFQDNIMKEINKDLSIAFHGYVPSRGIRTFEDPDKAFYVLRKTRMPAILTENGFYSNPYEANKMKEDDWVKKIADGHIAAIKYIKNRGIDYHIASPYIII